MTALYNPASIDIAQRQLFLGGVVTLILTGDLKLQEYYKPEERELWSSVKRTQFAESLLLGIPFGEVWLKEYADGTYCVLDGMKRLNVCADLYSVGLGAHEMRLDNEGLSVLTNLGEMDLSEWERPLQRRLANVAVTFNVVRSGTPDVAVRDLYERIKCVGRYS